MGLGGWQTSMGHLELCISPQRYIMFLEFVSQSYLSEISQMRHLLHGKGDNPQGAPMQERPHGVPAMWECAGRFGRGRKASVPCEMPLPSPAAPLQLSGAQPRSHLTVLRISMTGEKLQHSTGCAPALSPGLRRNNIPLSPSHANREASSVQFYKETCNKHTPESYTNELNEQKN